MDTLKNINIPNNEWVNLYEESNIAVGIRISVENVGSSDIYLTSTQNQPPTNHDSYVICNREGITYENDSG